MWKIGSMKQLEIPSLVEPAAFAKLETRLGLPGVKKERLVRLMATIILTSVEDVIEGQREVADEQDS
jgi:hypothetical protein